MVDYSSPQRHVFTISDRYSKPKFWGGFGPEDSNLMRNGKKDYKKNIIDNALYVSIRS